MQRGALYIGWCWNCVNKNGLWGEPSLGERQQKRRNWCVFKEITKKYVDVFFLFFFFKKIASVVHDVNFVEYKFKLLLMQFSDVEFDFSMPGVACS